MSDTDAPALTKEEIARRLAARGSPVKGARNHPRNKGGRPKKLWVIPEEAQETEAYRVKIHYYLDTPRRSNDERFFGVTDVYFAGAERSSAGIPEPPPALGMLRSRGVVGGRVELRAEPHAEPHAELRAELRYHPVFHDLDDGNGNHKVKITLHESEDEAAAERKKTPPHARATYDKRLEFPVIRGERPGKKATQQDAPEEAAIEDT